MKKKTISIIVIAFMLLSVGATAYIMFRVERGEPIIPDETQAGSCCKPAKAGDCSGCGGTWDMYRWCCYVGTAAPSSSQCTSGSQCNPPEYPSVAYCTSGTHWCSSAIWSQSGSGCTSNPKCSPGACPDGWMSCGVSGDSGVSASGCVRKTNCTSRCSGCSNPTRVYRYCKPSPPKCGDGKLGNTPNEECELDDPEGVTCSWDKCNQSTCSCPEPACGDGILGNTEGEECELNDPEGTTCTWDECNQSTCTCPEIVLPSCGDGILGNTEGEECELNDPDGVSCSWSDCEQETCTCPVIEEPICGDGIFGNTDGEECELNDPNGVSCLWSDCIKNTCKCPQEVPEVPELPETAIFDPSSIAIAMSVSMVLFGGVMGVYYYIQDSKVRREKKIVRKLGL